MKNFRNINKTVLILLSGVLFVSSIVVTAMNFNNIGNFAYVLVGLYYITAIALGLYLENNDRDGK